jgi:hypothetical protein
MDNGCQIKLHYFPNTGKGRSILHLEFSLPKLIFGNNVDEVTDISSAIEKANEVFKSRSELPNVDLSSGRMLRLDIPYNHQVGERAPDYINYLSKIRYPSRTTTCFPYETVYFKNKTIQTMFYDKRGQTVQQIAKGYLDAETKVKNQVQTVLKAASGLVRHEISYKKPHRIEKDFGYKARLKDVTPQKVEEVLKHDLTRLGINKPFAGTNLSAAISLANTYGSYAAPYYIGMLALHNHYSPDTIAEILDRHPSSIDSRVKKAVKEAGFAPVLNEGNHELPPLIIDLESKGVNMQQGMVMPLDSYRRVASKVGA